MHNPLAEIHLGRLVRNYRAIESHVEGARVVPVVKANAYGHGAVGVSRALQEAGVSMFAVFTVGEAQELRSNGITGDILVFARMTEDCLPLAVNQRLTLTVADPSDVELLLARRSWGGILPKVHIEVDTGMTRLGVNLADLGGVAEQLAAIPALEVEGLFSHYATSDEGDPAYAHLQLKRFRDAIEIVRGTGLTVRYHHIANSGGILNLPESCFNLVRIGMLLYGVNPSNEVRRTVTVEPVMSFKGTIVALRKVPKGTPVSYGKVYETPSDCVIGVVQAGFADGFPRNWFREGSVAYRGERFRVAGRVCMDQFMVNFEKTAPKIGDSVLLFGEEGADILPVEEIARAIELSPYVLLPAIGGRTEHVYLQN